MKLSLKQKALLQTVGFLLTAIVAAGIVNLILEYVPTHIIFNGMMAGVFGWIMYLIYSIVLLRLESEEAVKQRSEK